jgi:hypothetical protein
LTKAETQTIRYLQLTNVVILEIRFPWLTKGVIQMPLWLSSSDEQIKIIQKDPLVYLIPSFEIIFKKSLETNACMYTYLL